MPAESTSWLLSQGVLGFTTLILLGTVVYLYREIKSTVNRYEQMLADERVKHAADIAAERKSHDITQAARIDEMKQGWVTVNKVEDTLAKTLVIMQRVTT